MNEEYEQRQKEQRIEELYRFSGMDDIDRGIILHSPKIKLNQANKEVFGFAMWYSEAYPDSASGGTGFIVMGDLGVGKTWVCLAMLNYLITQKQVDCRYANVKSTLDEAKAAMDRDAIDPLYGIKRRDLLFFDDLGSERPTRWTIDALSTVVTYRYKEHLPTIYTTNARNWKELVEMLSEGQDSFHADRIVERIMERNHAILLKGKSWRKPLRVMPDLSIDSSGRVYR